MTIKVPIRTVYDENDNPTGLAEFQSGEAVNYTHGGTGLTSLGAAGQTLAVNSTTDGLEWVTGQELDNTDELPEGSTNLYYTDARSRVAVSVTDAGGDGSMAYNNSTGVITYTGPSATDVRSHFSGGTGVDISSGVVSIGQSVAIAADVTFNTVTADLTGDVTGNITGNVTGDVTGTVSSLSNHDTDGVTEGSTNLYYTDARAQAAISVTDAGGDGSLAYSSGTITYTGPSATETRAHFSAGTGVTYSSGEFSIGQAVATASDVTFNCITTACNITIGGNLTVNGTTVTNNADNLVVDDALIELNHSATSNASDLGLIMERGSTGDNAFIGWDESADKFVVGTTAATGASSGDLSITTGTLLANIEGNVTGNVAGNVTGNVTGTVSSLSNHDTDGVAEGLSNLYYTDARARSAVSFTAGSGAYNSSTGAFSIPTNTNQLTNGAGYITCTGSISGNAATATSATSATSATCASKWTTARTLCICGDASGSASIDGSGNVNLSVAVADDSHNHTVANVDGLATCLSGKASTTCAGTIVTCLGTKAPTNGSLANNFSANCFCADICAKSPIVCGSTCVVGPIVCATTQMCAPIVCGTSCLRGQYVYSGGIVCAATCVEAANCVKSGVVCGTTTRGTTACFTDFNSTSDCRCKDDIKTIDSAVCKVTQMRGVDFKWKDDGRKSIGVIAQEVEKVLPELVVTDKETGYKTVNYQSMVGVLIEAVKDLQAQVDDLKKNK